MAIVGACLATLRPLFSGVDSHFLSSLSWTSRRITSSSSGKSGGWWLSRKDSSKSDQKKEKKRSELRPERHKSDAELVRSEQMENLGAERLNRSDICLEDGSSTATRIKIEEAFV